MAADEQEDPCGCGAEAVFRFTGRCSAVPRTFSSLPSTAAATAAFVSPCVCNSRGVTNCKLQFQIFTLQSSVGGNTSLLLCRSTLALRSDSTHGTLFCHQTCNAPFIIHITPTRSKYDPDTQNRTLRTNACSVTTQRRTPAPEPQSTACAAHPQGSQHHGTPCAASA